MAGRRRMRELLDPDTPAESLSREEVARIWRVYWRRKSIELRNRLAEVYAPAMHGVAQQLAHRYRTVSADDLASDLLLLLVNRMIPQYRGGATFATYAYRCGQRLVADRIRSGRRRREDVSSDMAELSKILPAREAPGCDLRFLELTADMDHRDATVLWLRIYRGLSVAETARVLSVPGGTIKSRMHRACVHLRGARSGRLL